MPFDYFLSENQARAVRWSEAPGVAILKRAMSHLHGRAAAEQWRATGHYKMPDSCAYAILARCAALVAA